MKKGEKAKEKPFEVVAKKGGGGRAKNFKSGRWGQEKVAFPSGVVLGLLVKKKVKRLALRGGWKKGD